jgi:hypothetical protein
LSRVTRCFRVLGGDCVAAPADLFKERIRRQPVLGGPINEYERAA